jgi:hypothetical protein
MLKRENAVLNQEIQRLSDRVSELERNNTSSDYYTSGVEYDDEGNPTYYDNEGYDDYDTGLRTAIAQRPR